MLLLRFDESLSFRFAHRTLIGSLIHEPPRSTRGRLFGTAPNYLENGSRRRERGKNASPQAQRPPETRVRDPRLDGTSDGGRLDLATIQLIAQIAEPAGGADHGRARQTQPAVAQDEAEERDRTAGPEHAAFLVVQLEPQRREQLDDTRAQFPERGAIVAEDQKVVAVADVFAAALAIHDEVVQLIEHHVGEELRGQAADRQAAPSFARREEAVARKPLLHGLLRRTFVEHAFEHLQERLVADHAPDRLLHHGVVETREELDEIALQAETAAARQAERSSQRPMGSFLPATGVGVGDEAALEERLEQRDQRVMHDAITEGRRANQPRLRVADPEGAARFGTPRPGPQSLREREALRLEIEEKARDITPLPFAARRGARAGDQEGGLAELREEPSVAAEAETGAEALCHPPICFPSSTRSSAK